MKRRIEIKELLSFLGDNVIRIEGIVGKQYVDHLADVSHVDETTLDWINPAKENKQQIVESSKAKIILVGEGILYTDALAAEGKLLIVVKDPKVQLARVGNHFFVNRPVLGIHPTVHIDPDAIIGNRVTIGEYTVIGKATIGDNTIIDSHVRIYDNVELGRNCRIKAGAVLGGEGFGFERDKEGNLFRFPQIGRLLIGDNVEIGSNTCVDRGALSDTIIGDHTKINNLCHIAHNNIIGKNVAIAGCVNISGSCTIDDDVWISPNASLRGFNHIGFGCTIGTGAVVTKNIPANETWVGNPARKLEKK